MKVRIFCLLVMILASGSAQNLLQNPGFETWVGNMPEHWQRDDSIAIFQEDVTVHGGNFSVRESLFTQTQSEADFFQGRFPVSPNTEYMFGAWILDDDMAGRVRLAIRWYFGSDSQNVWGDSYSANSAAWQELTYNAISPANADSALAFIRAYDSSSTWDGDAIFYFDDTYFAPTGTQAPLILRFWHTPTNPGSGITVTVLAHVVDDGTIDYDTLYYGVNDLNTPITMTHTSVANDTFLYQIPGLSSGDTVFYYLKFVDDDALLTVSDTHSYYVGALGVWINELYYDAPSTDTLCFIELFGAASMSLNGFELIGVNGYNGVAYATIDLDGHVLPSDGFFVIGDLASVPNVDLVDPLANLQNGPDNVELRFHGIIVDALGYGTMNGWVFTGEWLPAADVEPGHSLGRYPDGDDTDNNAADFNDYEFPSPGLANPSVGISEDTRITSQLPSPVIMNPVRSGISYQNVISKAEYYPLTIYNAMGQKLLEIQEPDRSLVLPTGVYFIEFSKLKGGCAKMVVVR